eukprot:366563-Chlamydomonas_euryale.AAC.9
MPLPASACTCPNLHSQPHLGQRTHTRLRQRSLRLSRKAHPHPPPSQHARCAAHPHLYHTAQPPSHHVRCPLHSHPPRTVHPHPPQTAQPPFPHARCPVHSHPPQTAHPHPPPTAQPPFRHARCPVHPQPPRTARPHPPRTAQPPSQHARCPAHQPAEPAAASAPQPSPATPRRPSPRQRREETQWRRDVHPGRGWSGRTPVCFHTAGPAPIAAGCAGRRAFVAVGCTCMGHACATARVHGACIRIKDGAWGMHAQQ